MYFETTQLLPICILYYFSMKFCTLLFAINYDTYFDVLFPSVVIDFPFLRLNFEISKFVHCRFLQLFFTFHVRLGPLLFKFKVQIYSDTVTAQKSKYS